MTQRTEEAFRAGRDRLFSDPVAMEAIGVLMSRGYGSCDVARVWPFAEALNEWGYWAAGKPNAAVGSCASLEEAKKIVERKVAEQR